MNQLMAKIREVEQDIAREKGPLNLCALLEREDLPFDRWDLVISAPWARHDEGTLRYLAETLGRHLVPDEMTLLARFVILDANEEPVTTITDSYQLEHELVELHHLESLGLPLQHGYIITSRPAA
jgi:hypothetical protein